MIKIFAMDVDGTLTNGKINISPNGELFKSFDVKDGMGIKLLLQNNIIPVIITGRCSEIVTNRANELNISYVFQNVDDKLEKLNEICEKFNVTYDQIAYIGDDVNDLSIMKKLVNSYAPADAVREVKNSVAKLCKSNGGCGAVREAIEDVLIINKGSEL